MTGCQLSAVREVRSRRGGADPARGSSAVPARSRAGGWATQRRARRAGSVQSDPSAARWRRSSRRCSCSRTRGRACRRACRRARDGTPADGASSRWPPRRGSPRAPSSLPGRACRTGDSGRCRSPPGSEAPGGRAHRGGGAATERDDARSGCYADWVSGESRARRQDTDGPPRRFIPPTECTASPPWSTSWPLRPGFATRGDHNLPDDAYRVLTSTCRPSDVAERSSRGHSVRRSASDPGASARRSDHRVSYGTQMA